jgi:DNA-binding transcriptional regulator/RsmH inhibitor MraZ
MVEEEATKSTIAVFEKFRDQMGDDVFGELVLFVGEEAKRLALVARDGPEQLERTIQ